MSGWALGTNRERQRVPSDIRGTFDTLILLQLGEDDGVPRLGVLPVRPGETFALPLLQPQQ